MDKQSILIVEDQSIVALDLRLRLEELGYAVTGVAPSGEEAIRAVGRRLPDVILMDVRLQGPLDGIDTAARLKLTHDLPVIFLTAHSDADTVQRAAVTGAYGYLTKPYQVRELRAAIEVALTKHRMERQLREADRWFAHTLRCVQDGVIVVDLDTRIRFMNPAAERLTGWSLEDGQRRPLEDVVRFRAADAATQLKEAVEQARSAGRPAVVGHGLALVGRDGEPVHVDESVGPVDDDQGRRLGSVLILRDAAPRLAQEAILRASEERFHRAFEFAPLGMALVSLAGEFLQVNEAFCHLLGSECDEVKARGHGAVTLAADREHEETRLAELRREPLRVVQFEKRYLGAAGEREPVWTLVSVSLLREAGEATCYLYQVHDLTAQKVAAERLAELAAERMRREASDIANQAKSEFLSRVSHEMRTPLNAVMGFAQLLQLNRIGQDAKTGAYAAQILTAGEHLLALVNDLLDLQRAAHGGLRLVIETVDLVHAVDVVIQFLQPQAGAQGLAMPIDIPAGLAVRADAVRLRQVLLNVASNAVKYNRPGGRVAFTAARRAPDRVALTIEDDGLGMAAEQVERLFQPFERLGRERTAIPGIGLGLVIARSLVAEMGGSLEVASAPGTGTAVTIVLPEASPIGRPDPATRDCTPG